MVQQVKDPVAAEAWVRSLAWELPQALGKAKKKGGGGGGGGG